MVRLKEVGILSCGYIYGIITGIVSLLYVLIFMPMFMVIQNGLQYTSDISEIFESGMVGGWIFIVILILAPILGAVSGFICGCIGAIIYNLAAKWTGGVEMIFEKKPAVKIKTTENDQIIIEEEPLIKDSDLES